MQITYEHAFRAWSTLREPGACRAWLFRIARNAYLNERRTQRARSELQLVDLDVATDLPAVPADVVERLNARELEHALSKLSQDHREALLLSDLWGFTYAEIAEIVSIPVGTVRSRIARARDRIMRELGEVVRDREHRRG